MSDITKENVVETAFEKAEKYIASEVITVKEPGTGVEVVGIKQGGDFNPIHESVFDNNRIEPKRIIDSAKLTDLKSFIAYTNRFKDQHSALFMDDERTAPSLTAVIDYHPEGGPDAPGRFGDHRARFNFPLSDQWKVWNDKNGEKMSMYEFATFLENHIVDVMGTEFVVIADSDEETKRFFSMMGGKAALAEPAKLLEVANNLTINEKSHVTSAQNLSSGEGVIEFKSEHETIGATGRKMTVPKMFAIGIPVFKNDAPYRIFARLRYRKGGEGIRFWYELWGNDRVFDHAIVEAGCKAATDTALPLFNGCDR